MENYKSLVSNPNEVFGFTKPIETVAVPTTSTPPSNLGLIFVGGILLVVLIWLYQGSQIKEMKKVVFYGKMGKEKF